MATPIDDDTLQRFYDGDLSPLEEHSLQTRIEADPDAQRRLAQLGRLTELMREAADELGKSVDSAALFAGIETRLATPEPLPARTRLRVIAGEWLEHKRATLAPIATAVAVAAATLMVVIRPSTSDQVGSAIGESPIVAVHGSTVEDVDFGPSTGTVFAIDNQGVAVAVVWITEDEETP